MSYSFGHGGSGGEYHSHAPTQTHAQIPSPTTPMDLSSECPQWESLEQLQQQQRVEPQTASIPPNQPIQPIQQSFFTPDDSRFHSPTETQSHQAMSHIPHRLSFDDSYNLSPGSSSPRESGFGIASSSSATPTTSTRGSRNTTALRRSHARSVGNPYPASSMHAMQPPPPPAGREHRVDSSGSRGVFGHQNFRSHHQQPIQQQQPNPQAHQNQHRSPQANSNPHSPGASTVLGSPGPAITSFGEANVRTSPYTPPAGGMFPPLPPPTPHAPPSAAHTPPQATATSPQTPHDISHVQQVQAQYQTQTHAHASPTTRTSQPHSQRRPRLTPRADFHYDSTSQTLNVSMELPGVKKTQLKVTLATCIFNRVRQLIVKGRMDPVFPKGGERGDGEKGGAQVAVAEEEDPDVATAVTGAVDNGQNNGCGSKSGAAAVGPLPPPSFQQSVRERKYGDFSRIVTVPSETRKEDVHAEMEDGILTLKIACGPPAESADMEVIPIQ